jgi:hypothetical protein
MKGAVLLKIKLGWTLAAPLAKLLQVLTKKKKKVREATNQDKV